MSGLPVVRRLNGLTNVVVVLVEICGGHVDLGTMGLCGLRYVEAEWIE